MRKVNDIKPITSPLTLKLLAQELKNTHEDYYIVFRIMIETGYYLGALLECHVKDLRDKDTLHIRTCKRYDVLREARLSETLKAELSEFFKDKSDNEFAFVSRKTGEKLHFGSYKNALKAASRRLGIDPPVTVSALELTYKYNQYIESPDTAHSTGKQKNYKSSAEHFGLSPKERADLLATSHKATLKKLEKAEKELTKLENAPERKEKGYSYALKYLSSINAAVDKLLLSLKK